MPLTVKSTFFKVFKRSSERHILSIAKCVMTVQDHSKWMIFVLRRESRMLRASLPSSGRLSVSLSVRLSVTLVNCIKTVQARITKSSLWAAPMSLVYRDKISCHWVQGFPCLLYTSPSPRDRTRSRMPSSA